MKGTLLVTLLVGLLWRLVAVYLWGFPNHPVTPAFVSPLMTWFDWTLGAFVAERFFHGRRAFDARQVWLWLLLFLFVASTLFKPLLTLSFSLAAAAGAVALDAALQRSWRKNLWTTAFAFLGLISYSLYLWHQPLLIRASYHLAYFHGSPYLAWSVVVPLLVIGSWFSYYLLEKVGIRAGDKLWAFRDRCSRAFYHLHHWRVRGAAEGKFHWRWAWPFGKPYLREDLRLYSDGGGIGDELMCTPIFREIRRLNPDCHLTFISRYPAVFRSNPNLDAVEPFSAKAIRGAIQLTYGPAVPPRRQLITLMAECVGLKLEATQLDAPVMMPTPELGAKIGSFTKPLIVIQPQASRWTPNKQWPIESWTELIRMLTAEFEVVEVGQETLFSRPDFGERFHSFVGKTTIADFGWLIAQAAVFVGPVSGGMHFANAFQVRSVVIFGGYESPAGHQYPLMQAFFSDVPCAQCWLTTPCPYDRKCLSMIQPAEVFRTVRAAALDPLWLPS
jgi:ADP-heptose:LPS heptosyltransferase